jgi:hypothetical protein
MTVLWRWWAALFERNGCHAYRLDESDLAQATTLAELEWRMRQLDRRARP